MVMRMCHHYEIVDLRKSREPTEVTEDDEEDVPVTAVADG